MLGRGAPGLPGRHGWRLDNDTSQARHRQRAQPQVPPQAERPVPVPPHLIEKDQLRARPAASTATPRRPAAGGATLTARHGHPP